jgi:ABC-type branched-subunit amino acid transport system ATPase component
MVYELFPRLAERHRQFGSLSGGEADARDRTLSSPIQKVMLLDSHHQALRSGSCARSSMP